MKIVLISDTHGKHSQIVVPEGDMIIHAGDICNSGKSMNEVNRFLDWYQSLSHKHKIMIAGNHDFPFEDDFLAGGDYVKTYTNGSVIYLDDSGVEIEGKKIWGSPVQPWFHSWAFNRYRGKDIQQHWDLIPSDIEILITHGPPYGIGDLLIPKHRKIGQDPNVGCEDLLNTIESRLKSLKLHVFGHIHSGYGIVKNLNPPMFINASVLDDDYQSVNKPIVIEYE
jgi:Icc-related predicted phosphoesterase